MRLSVIVLTKNEERNIEECLVSVSFADERLVVDSGSTDSTVALAEKHGARVVAHPLKDFSTQRNFAMSQALGDWVLFIDADERVTPELAEEIKFLLKGSDPLESSGGLTPLCVYAIPRHNYFFGKRLRCSDSGGDSPVRLFPKQAVTWMQPVHEMIVTDLPLRKLQNPIIHYSTRDLAHYKQKVRDYVPLELKTMKSKGMRPSLLKAIFLPPAKFAQLYFLKGGIFDGRAGFQYAILSAYFYTFQKHWRYWKRL
jgi:glycosyltransferase involved in cell wall biosynthesis